MSLLLARLIGKAWRRQDLYIRSLEESRRAQHEAQALARLGQPIVLYMAMTHLAEIAAAMK